MENINTSGMIHASLCSNGRSACHVTPLGCEGVYEYVKDKIYEPMREREICYFMWMCVGV